MDKFIKTLFAICILGPAYGQNQVEMADQPARRGEDLRRGNDHLNCAGRPYFLSLFIG